MSRRSLIAGPYRAPRAWAWLTMIPSVALTTYGLLHPTSDLHFTAGITLSRLSIGVVAGIFLILSGLAISEVRRSEHANCRYKRSAALDILLPIAKATDAQACLEEIYPFWLAAHGARTAELIRVVQIIRIIAGNVLAPMLVASERILKIVRGV
jgi:hypothetical protein